MEEDEVWLLCPHCKCKTRVRVLKETQMRMFPLFCPKCKKETLVNVVDQNMIIVERPDAETQS